VPQRTLSNDIFRVDKTFDIHSAAPNPVGGPTSNETIKSILSAFATSQARFYRLWKESFLGGGAFLP
jgi:hypothetical protein